jgi:hypothetical protein
MSVIGILFAVFLLVYLAECLWWVQPGASIFTLGIRGRGTRKEPGFIWNALDLEGVLANPLPPLTPLVVTYWPEFQPEPDRFCYSRPGAEPVSIPWEGLAVTCSDSRLLCNGVPVLKAGEAQIKRQAEFLRQTAKLKPARRARAIEEWLRRGADQKAAGQQLETFRRQSLGLRIVTNIEFFLLFLLVPLAFHFMGTRVIWPVVAALVAVAASITLEFWMLHRALFREASGARFKSALTIMLSPVSAVRACDAITRELFTGYHPLAVAAAILPEEGFNRFAGERLRACRYDLPSGGWYAEALRNALENLIRQRGIQPESLMFPSSQQANCVAWCPRCLAQYVTHRAQCADCGYEGLVAFPSTAAKE